MKKLLLLFAVVGLLFACSGGGPRSTAESFVKEMSKGNLTEAGKYCTQEAAAMLTLAASMGPMDEMKEAFSEVKYVREEIDGDKAKVFFKDKEGEEIDPVDLVKIDGEWKVVLSK